MSDRRRAVRRRLEEDERRNGSKKSAQRDGSYRVSLISIGLDLVNDRELEAIELYLGQEIDHLLGRACGPQARGPPE
ncbi:hypothetical protein JQ621_18045 [Bradyrhizobium manausense]|jgi:hypothetical protein|uniref:hypothetical protein n=1 Tax=Bradyrhizobium manausense TaxID=989370 RepID=UPI001BA46FE2|nr:hypothetical protein [Bradyrhizobium manausense]MBR1089368.1 hypothetical protein [Bradyrhizobium manausense]